MKLTGKTRIVNIKMQQKLLLLPQCHLLIRGNEPAEGGSKRPRRIHCAAEEPAPSQAHVRGGSRASPLSGFSVPLSPSPWTVGHTAPATAHVQLSNLPAEDTEFCTVLTAQLCLGTGSRLLLFPTRGLSTMPPQLHKSSAQPRHQGR